MHKLHHKDKSDLAEFRGKLFLSFSHWMPAEVTERKMSCCLSGCLIFMWYFSSQIDFSVHTHGRSTSVTGELTMQIEQRMKRDAALGYLIWRQLGLLSDNDALMNSLYLQYGKNEYFPFAFPPNTYYKA